MLCGTNLIKLHHFAGMATKPLWLGIHHYTAEFQQVMVSVPRMFFHWNQETLGRPTVDTVYHLLDGGPQLPLQWCWSVDFLAKFQPPSLVFWQRGSLHLERAGLRDWKRNWGNEGPNKYTQIHLKKLSYVSVSHLPSLASVKPACLLGAHQTEFLDPTSKNRPTKCQGRVFSWDKWDLQIQIQVKRG